ncbi:MAG: ComF family protein, partial [Legionellales bacterium]|nr:ComF family protein [Legionellales bacterium]
QQLKIPILRSATRRIKATAAQSGLTAKARKHNIKKAFWVDPHFHAQRILVIDDVITTGQTMHEFCRTLQQQGIPHIDVACCAKRMRK